MLRWSTPGCWLARRRGLNLARVLDAALAAAVGGVIGGRAAYVAAKWGYYQDHVRRALRPWDRGLSGHGAPVSGRVTVPAHCTVRQTHSSRCWRRWRWTLSRRISGPNAAPWTDRHML